MENSKQTRIEFLREVYTKDPLISNADVLRMLLATFPTSNANKKSIIMWKKILRDEGMPIPKDR